MALIANPTRPLEVVWACRTDREEARRRRVEADAQRNAAAAQAAWIEERDRMLAAVDLLQPEIRESLMAAAARGPAGLRLSAEAPLFMMNLVRIFNARKATSAAP